MNVPIAPGKVFKDSSAFASCIPKSRKKEQKKGDATCPNTIISKGLAVVLPNLEESEITILLIFKPFSNLQFSQLAYEGFFADENTSVPVQASWRRLV